ncbi:MAG: type II toxin-antitoxin system VapB family antitoxin [Planctomycetota bacterium]
MATNLQIDMALLETAVKLGGFRTKRETVNQALRKFIQLARQKELKQYLGKVAIDPAWDYKKARSRA